MLGASRGLPQRHRRSLAHDIVRQTMAEAVAYAIPGTTGENIWKKDSASKSSLSVYLNKQAPRLRQGPSFAGGPLVCGRPARDREQIIGPNTCAKHLQRGVGLACEHHMYSACNHARCIRDARCAATGSSAAQEQDEQHCQQW